MNEVELCDIENYSMPDLEPVNEANDYGNYKGSAANHQYVFENVIDVLKNVAQPDVDPKDGLAVIEFIESVYKFRE